MRPDIREQSYLIAQSPECWQLGRGPYTDIQIGKADVRRRRLRLRQLIKTPATLRAFSSQMPRPGIFETVSRPRSRIGASA